MTVTKIEPLTKTKYKVFLDEQFAFVLYKRELSHYHLEEGTVLEHDVYSSIRNDTVLKRAKLRALHLLSDMGRTESQLRNKLSASGYPPDVVEDVIVYVKSFGYVDDLEYARSFIDTRKCKKSKKELYADLCQKGVDRDIIDRALEDCYGWEDTQAAISGILRKKHYNPETADDRQKKKIFGYLSRKGFACGDICRAIQVSEWNA